MPSTPDREEQSETPSRFAWLAVISLMPLLAVVVIAEATATALNSGDRPGILPTSTEDLMRIGLVGGLAAFIAFRLWVLTARSSAVTVSDAQVELIAEAANSNVGDASVAAARDLGDQEILVNDPLTLPTRPLASSSNST